MNKVKKTREDVINELIEQEMDVNFSDLSYVREALEGGWVGYGNMDNEELADCWNQDIGSSDDEEVEIIEGLKSL